MKQLIPLLALVVLLSSCGHKKWYRPGCTDEQVWKDIAETKLEAQKIAGKPRKERGGLGGGYKKIHRALMAERGYLALTPEQIVVARRWTEEAAGD